MHPQLDSRFLGQSGGLFELCCCNVKGGWSHLGAIFGLAGLILGFAGLILDPFCKYAELTCKLIEGNLGSEVQNADFPERF